MPRRGKTERAPLPVTFAPEPDRCARCGRPPAQGHAYRLEEAGSRIYCRPCFDQLYAGLRHLHRPEVASRLKFLYKISIRDYGAMYAKQNGVCAICKDRGTPRDLDDPVLCVDHDHATGVVRGLLCRRCNSAIGLLADNPVHLASAIAYLMHPPGVTLT